MMAGYVKKAMSYLGMTDVVDDDDELMNDSSTGELTGLDSDDAVMPITASDVDTSASSTGSNSHPFPNRGVDRIVTFHPKEYKDADKVGRALRDGVPVVLNLTGVPGPVARRILDFAAGVDFGVSGSIERVTPTVFLLSPAQVNINAPESADGASDLF
jgi:cell division inhibitor SepF